MKKNLALLFSILFFGFSSCSSDDDDNGNVAGESVKIDLAAGALSQHLETKGLLKSTNLVLSGEMNIYDFIALGEMPYLQELDLTDVNIVAATRYDEDYKQDFKYVADVLSLHYLHKGNEVQTIEGDPSGNKYPICRVPNLVTIKLPKSLKGIEAMGLALMTKLKTITIPDNVTAISYAFAGCKELETVVLPNNYSGTIGGNAFAFCPKLSTINLTDNVAKIQGGAFYGCTSLKSVVLPKNMTIIDQYTFTNSGLESITIPASVTSIAPGAFENNKNLKEVTFASGSQLGYIHDYAFSNCTALTTITLPKNVVQIDRTSFVNVGFTSMYLESTQPPSISLYGADENSSLFTSIKKCVLYVPTGSKAIYENPDNPLYCTDCYKYWTMFKEIKEFNP